VGDLVEKEVPKGRKQERAKTAAFAAERLNVVALEQHDKERLRQIAGVQRVVSKWSRPQGTCGECSTGWLPNDGCGLEDTASVV
jgi:hypothetical protein